ncbi:MAG: sulfite exporter TauE/SafE family protein [Candidatus Sumerlaeia bacterium]|nr:sulfite exporter TauE/SafE family protein [Candidatus Sumerlaeia bacterium]
MSPLELLLLLAAGLVAGFMNTVAGGGSLLTLPALIFSGIPATEANATNRLGLLAQSLVSTGKLYHVSEPQTRRVLWLVLPLALLGGILGTWTATWISSEHFEKVLAFCLVLMLVLILRKPTPSPSPSAASEESTAPANPALLVASFLGLGFYSGFIQAGMGVVTLMVLRALTSLSLVQANALKVILILILTVQTLALFWWQGVMIHLAAGGIMAVAQMVGAWAGSKVAVGETGEKVIRWSLVAMTLTSAVVLLV